MGSLPEAPKLASLAKTLEELRWAAFILDSHLRLAWVSDEIKGFMGEDDDDALGVGSHIIEAFIREAWRARILPEGQVRMFMDLGPYLIAFMDDEERARLAELPEPFRSMIDQLPRIDLADAPPVVASWFEYLAPGQEPYRVDIVVSVLRDLDGGVIGAWSLTFMGVRPRLVALLSQGDEEMYERMAELVTPSRRQAAVLFCDVEGTGSLSRKMPTASYFALMRRVGTCIDAAIAKHRGVIGKHSGDGATAFFLVDHLGSASRACAAAVAAARQIVHVAGLAFEEVISEFQSDDELDFAMNVGLHWGGTLYVGQLVPGGRLDVTALGDEMNECARIQESARGIVASKSLIEQLRSEDAEGVGIDPDLTYYRPLSELPAATEKAIRDAGSLPVADL
jgi:class 3 adenylate cyclase